MTVFSQSLKSELECHKNNSLLAQRKKKKESKGEIQISHKEVPPPACKSWSIKTERVLSALSIASYLWSWDLCVSSNWYTLCWLHLLLFGEEVSSLSGFPRHSFHRPCIQIVKMEGVQPLDENVGNAPGRRFLRNKLLLVASIIQGLGLLLCLTYICLHFYAQVRCTNQHVLSSSSGWWQLQMVTWK